MTWQYQENLYFFGLCDSLMLTITALILLILPTTPTNQTFGNNLNTDQISNLTYIKLALILPATITISIIWRL